MNIDREVRHVSILEERVPEKIEREIATSEKKEGDLGDAVEFKAK